MEGKVFIGEKGCKNSMRLTIKIIVSLFLLALTNSVANAQQDKKEPNKRNILKARSDFSQEAYKDWQKVALRQFSFYVPKNFRLEEVKGIDTTEWHYKSDEINFIVIMGAYAPSYSVKDKKTGSLKYKSFQIDNIDAEMWFYEVANKEYNYISAIHFQPPMLKVSSVTIYLESKALTGQQIAEKVFKSIRFNVNQNIENKNTLKYTSSTNNTFAEIRKICPKTGKIVAVCCVFQVATYKI